jgi:hypothetical protein
MHPKRLLVCPRRCRNPPGGAVSPLDIVVLPNVSMEQFHVSHQEATLGRNRSKYLVSAVGIALIVVHGVWFAEPRQVPWDRWPEGYPQGSLLCRPVPCSRRTDHP